MRHPYLPLPSTEQVVLSSYPYDSDRPDGLESIPNGVADRLSYSYEFLKVDRPSLNHPEHIRWDPIYSRDPRWHIEVL
jgi:hypothetical protein